jgi:predicted O-methyltransferase YrrM/DNA-binding transcriptional ArsR family regulator
MMPFMGSGIPQARQGRQSRDCVCCPRRGRALPDDGRIYDAYIAGRQSAALAAAVRVGLFDLLADEPLAPEEIARQLDLRPRGLRALLRVLAAMGLVSRSGERVTLSADASSFLVRGKRGWLGGLIDLEVDHFLDPARVLEALRRDGASIYGEEDPWARHAVDPERARAFTVAMHSISELPGGALAEAIDLSSVRRLLDVGGGSGAVSIELAGVWPQLRACVWDLGTVCAVAQEYIDAADLGDRVQILAGDIFAEPWPTGYDAALFSQILHDWPPERGRELVARAVDALPAGGLVLVHEKLLTGDAPLANALVDLDMLVWTEGQQWEVREVTALLADLGLEGITHTPTVGYWSVVVGAKP